ncbi:transcriptional regulator, GntR family [Paracoccus aminophilus JCM 7686]|uniref:Transcriptional regulator, GntR family n=2 Tax=Paracoccus aminophilus TaxID=34003 RepID=S5XRS7_PARAH|nr:transcriptional regulator, GntR family [Paracoccus aminophilus JCM 7686]
MPHRMMTWQSVQTEVLSRIRSGFWRPGQLIPTESELAIEFGCARATVNRALTSLAASGLLERRRKVGTRIAKHPPQRSTLPKTALRNEIEAAGATYGYRLISIRRATPPADIAKLLMLKSGQATLEIRAEFSANDQPYCGEERWIAIDAAPGIEQAPLNEISAFEWLSDNVALNHGSLSVSATSAQNEFVSNALSVQRGTPVLLIERGNWADAVAVTVSRQYFPAGHTLSALY